MDIEKIKRIPINTSLPDKIKWHYDRTREYSVKSGYKLYVNTKINEASSSSNPMGNVWNRLWNLRIPNKIKIFYQKALNNFIPTHLNLLNRGINSYEYCPICHKYLESTNHSLFACNRAKEI